MKSQDTRDDQALSRPPESRLGWRRFLGPLVLVTAIVAGGSLLEVMARIATGEAWLVRAYLVLGLALVAFYVFAVSLPARQRENELRELRHRHARDCSTVQAALEEMRHGDLVATLNPIGGLAPDVRQAVESAARSMSSLVQQIQSSSVDVAHAAMTVQETSAELASASSQQAAAVVEITATTEELARTAGQIATNAAGQAELSRLSEEAGTEGAKTLAAAVSGVESVQQRIDGIASRADILGSRSREIYQVLELIREIAQETHILSLNAAIEAAAAGEHGERFAVVAEEVRRLAERSRESVESVRNLVDEFAGAVRAVVVATEEGSKTVRQVIGQTRSTEESMEQLRGALSDTARTAREISLATQEQRTASDQVVLTLKEVSEVIQRMADGLNQFTGAAERLNSVALSIQLLTQSFRIDSDHSIKNQLAGWVDDLRDVEHNLEAVEGTLNELLRRSPYVELAYLVDPRGVMVAFALNRDLVRDDHGESLAVGQSYIERPWFQAVRRDGRATVTPLYESLLTGAQCFTIAAAVRNHVGAVVGTLGVDVNVRNWTRI